MKEVVLFEPESQEDCDNMETCDVCSYYSVYNSYGCETFLEDLENGD